MTELLLVSAGWFHPPWPARRVVRRALTAVAGIHFTQIRSLNTLPELDMDRFQALVLYFHHKKLTHAALAAFKQFVNDGGGVLAIHSATASFKEQPGYLGILGGSFAGHGPVEPFAIRPAADSGPFAGIGPFTVTDELYIHDLQPDIDVHFTAQHEGRPQPMVWTRRAGAGRVCYICPGHRTATMQQPEMQAILRGGLKWVLARP